MARLVRPSQPTLADTSRSRGGARSPRARLNQYVILGTGSCARSSMRACGRTSRPTSNGSVGATFQLAAKLGVGRSGGIRKTNLISVTSEESRTRPHMADNMAPGASAAKRSSFSCRRDAPRSRRCVGQASPPSLRQVNEHPKPAIGDRPPRLNAHSCGVRGGAYAPPPVFASAGLPAFQTGMPSRRALSARLSWMPVPGKAMTPIGIASSI